MIILQCKPETVLRALRDATRPVVNPEPLFTALASDLERSVRKNFRAGGRPLKWQVSRWGMQEGRKTLIRRGLLLNSISRRHTGKEATVFTNNPYARIHEFGGVILPKRAKALTVPLSPLAEGKRAGDFDRKQTFLLKRDGKAPVIMLKQEQGEPIALFVLLKSVRIPARPFMEPPASDLQVMKERVERFVAGR